MKKNAFTLIELLAVIVVLTIILAIAVPSIIGVIKNSSKAAFQSDAKMLLKAIDYKKLENENYVPSNLTLSKIEQDLKLSSLNYQNVAVEEEANQVIIKIVGKNKWEGLSACGTSIDMKIYEDDNCGGTADIIPPVLTLKGDDPLQMYIGDIYVDSGFTASDNGKDLTADVIVTSNINTSVPGTYKVDYKVMDAFSNLTMVSRTIIVIDNQTPTISFNPNGSHDYVRGVQFTINVIDSGGVDSNSLKYVWTATIDEPTRDAFDQNYTNLESLNTPSGVSGAYYLWAMASDIVGNETIIRSNAFNLDNEKPVITLNGSSSINLTKGSIYTDLGATVSDNFSTDIIIDIASDINPNVIGSYTVTYNAVDEAGNTADTVIRTVNVIDVLAPVITLNGNNIVNIYVGNVYTDAGATATDDVDGDVTSKIVTTGTVNPNVAGSYTITYTVSDTAGNSSTLIRTVNVIDNISPTVSFGTNGNSAYAKSYSTTVTVSDAHTGVNANTLKYLWNTSTSQPSEASFTLAFTNGGNLVSPAGVTGSYYLWILAKDNVGNTIITRSNAFNLDNTTPVITLNGSSTVVIDKGTPYTDAGATATDAHSGISGSITTTGSVNISVVGTYVITYNVNDKAGNAAIPVTRTVTVKETQVLASQTVTFTESTSSSQSKIVNLPGLVSVTSVTVNTGSVSYGVSGQNITLNVSGGAYTRYESVGQQVYDCWPASCCYTSCWSCTQSYTGTCCGCPGDVWPSPPSSCCSPCQSCGYVTQYTTVYYYAYTVTVNYYKTT
jgi:prepilin-type N-terminal cleavage/methylation domain-containing protein